MAAHTAFETALEISQSVLDGQTGTIEAAHALCSLVHRDPSIASEEDRKLFIAITSETDDLPVGRVRQEWHPDSLPEKDHEIARCEDLWGDRIGAACLRIRRAALLTKLIGQGHISVAERLIVEPLKRQEVAALLRLLLLTDGIFPLRVPKDAVYEGASIMRTSIGAKITWERGYAWDPFTVAERRVRDFPDPDAAIEAFIDSEWPNGIDGVMLRNSD
jgi:hypothetical protein